MKNKQKKIVITGAGSGLGKLAAINLAKRGHLVYATTQYDYQMEDLKKISEKYDNHLKTFKMDILNDDDIEKLNDIDFNVLINNAGIGDSGSVAEVDIDRFRSVFETNVFRSIKVSQIALKKFIDNNDGRILFVASLFGKMTYPFLSPYCSTKFAIEAFATSLRSEMKMLDGKDIQIGIIEPGAYHTGFNQVNMAKKYDWMKDKSYFKYKLEEIKKKENLFFKIMEEKKFANIIKQYIKSVEDSKVKHRYTAPKLQAFLVNVGRFIDI